MLPDEMVLWLRLVQPDDKQSDGNRNPDQKLRGRDQVRGREAREGHVRRCAGRAE